MTGAQRSLWLGVGLLLVALAVLLLGAGVGSTGFDSVLNARHDPVAWQILWDIRLPRTLGAWMAGGLLGLAGAVAQGLFRNPLADPFLLGSASGAWKRLPYPALLTRMYHSTRRRTWRAV